MRYRIDHDYHIHTYLSSCSADPEQTAARIVQYARTLGLSRVCITDHLWDSAVAGASAWYAPQDLDHIKRILPLPVCEDVELLLGCETEMDRNGRIALHPDHYGDPSFIIVPTTHMHMKGFTVPDGADAALRARLWVQRLDALLQSDLPFGRVGLAHPVTVCMEHQDRAVYLDILRRLPEQDMERLFCLAAERGLGIELNADDMRFTDAEADTVLRPLRIAKSCGCKFYLGSDAHKPRELDRAGELFARAITLLDLRESDKFHISR